MAKEKFIDKIRLGSGMSLMIGNAPSKLDIAIIGTGKPKLDINRFGLFESATPNFETYYPDVKNAADITPDDSEFITPIFRMLSEVIVRKSYDPVDFSLNNVLKNSMGKLLGQTIYPNHESLVGNELGTVSEVFWQPGYVAQNGIKVPAGINGKFKIDAKSHPNVARKIMMEPPAIHSNSVTVQFEWEKSHPNLTLDEFRGKIGTYGPDGQLIRRIATDIRNYHETSLVPHGADPFAQVVDNKGNINNADYANSVYSLAAQDKEKPKFYYFNYREDLISLNSNPDEQHSKGNNQNQTDMKIKLTSAHVALLAFLAVKLKDGETEMEVELTADQLKGLNDKLTAGNTSSAALATAQAEVTQLKSDVANKTTEVTTLTAKVTTLKTEVTGLKTADTTRVTKLREEVKRIYTALKADKADAAIVASFESATPELLTAQIKQYTEELENKFPSTCGDCGSKNVSKASAKLGEGLDPAQQQGKVILKSDAEVEAEFLSGNSPKFALDR